MGGAMANHNYILLNTLPNVTLAPGVVYPVWEQTTIHRWGLITSNAQDNELLRNVLKKLGFEDPVASRDMAVYLWPFHNSFEGSMFIESLPDIQTTSPDLIQGSINVWFLKTESKVKQGFVANFENKVSQFPLLGLISNVSKIEIGDIRELPNVKFEWHFGLLRKLSVGDEKSTLPEDLFTFKYTGGWGTTLNFHCKPILDNAAQRPVNDTIAGRSILKVGNQLRLECKFSDEISISYFGAGLCRLGIEPDNVVVAFTEDKASPVGIYLSDQMQMPSFNVMVKMPLITKKIENRLPSLVIPSKPSLGFKLHLDLGVWGLNNDITGDPLLSFVYDDIQSNSGGFEFNRNVFGKAVDHKSEVYLELSDSKITGADFDHGDLTGTREAFSLSLSKVQENSLSLLKSFDSHGNFKSIKIPIGLKLDAGQLGKIFVTLCLDLDPVMMRIIVDDKRRIPFFLTPEKGHSVTQKLDLQAVAMRIPSRKIDFSNLPSKPHGYLDCLTYDFILLESKGATTEETAIIYFPGGLQDDDDDSGVDQRVKLMLKPVNFKELEPGHPLANNEEPILLVVGKSGVTFHAELRTKQSLTLIPPTESKKFRAADLRVLPTGSGTVGGSEIAMIDKKLLKGKMAFEMDMPGFENVTITGSLELRQSQRGKAPIVVATFDLSSSNGPITGKLGSKYFRAELSHITPRLSWDNGKWDVSVLATGAFAVDNEVNTSAAGSFKEEARLTFEKLELTKLHADKVTVSLSRRDPAVKFALLGGKLRCRMGHLAVSWDLTKNQLLLDCSDVSFDIDVGGGLKGGFDTGRLQLEIDDKLHMSAKFSEAITLRVELSPSFSFTGQAIYNKPSGELPYGEIGASGSVNVGGLNAEVILKMAAIVKEGGAVQPAIVIGGGKQINKQIAPAISVYSFLAGIAVNYRLRGISPHPTGTELVRNIDQLEPTKLENWDKVFEDGVYFAIFGTAELTSTVTAPDVTNGYVASVIACVDSQLRFLGAGRLWVASSINFARANKDRPVLLGGIAFLPREQELTLHLETRRNPAIEANAQLSRILSGAQGTLDFVATRKLADYKVRVVYDDTFFGVPMKFEGGIRVAIFDGAVLAKTWFIVSASYSNKFEKGSAGIEFKGFFSADANFRMLLDRRGITAYAKVDQTLTVEVKGWMEIEVLVWVEKSVKKLLEWITQREQEIQISRISGSMHARVNFNGTAGIQPDGNTGFTGLVNIVGSIGGRDFGIDVDFEVKKSVVDSSLASLIAYERRLDEAISALSGRYLLAQQKPVTLAFDESHSTANLGAASEPELWTINSVDQYIQGENVRRFLLLPQRFGKWYLPRIKDKVDTTDDYAVDEPVKRIEFLDSNDKCLHVLYPYWCWPQSKIKNQLSPTELKRFKQADIAFLPTAGPTNRAPTEEIVRDPRLESRSRVFWREADRLTYPDCAAPARLAPIDELLEDPNLAGLDEIVGYEQLRLRAQQAIRLCGEGLDETLQLERARGALIFALQEELLRTADSAQFASVGVSTLNDPNISEELGLVAQLSKDKYDAVRKIRVFRDSVNHVAEINTIHTRLSNSEQFRAMPWGLDFVEADQSQAAMGITASAIVQLFFFIPDNILMTTSSDNVYLGRIDIYRQFPGEKRVPIAKGITPGATRWQEGEKLYTFPEPIIHSDVFPIQGTTFADRRIIPERTPILYIFEVFDNRGLLLATGQWSPVRLFIPNKVSLPTSLCLVVAAENLVPEGRVSSNRGKIDEILDLALCSLNDGTAVLQDFTADDIEVYVDESPALSSGFYSGDEFQAVKPRGTAYLDDVQGDSRAESVSNLIRIPIESGNGKAGLLRVKRKDLKANFAYRFFVRLKTRNEDVMALPAKIGMVRRTRELAQSEKVKIARHLEWPVALDASVTWLEKNQFDADKVSFLHANWIRISWDSQQLCTGGAEIIIVDHDDPEFILRKRVEVFQHYIFRDSEQDLSVPTAWTLDISELGNLKAIKSERIFASSEPRDYYIDEKTLKNRSIVQGLNPEKSNSPAHELSSVLGKDASNLDWREIYRLSVRYLRVWTNFIRSPLNCNNEHIRSLEKSMPDLFTAMMVGIKTSVENTNGSILERINKMKIQSQEIKSTLDGLQNLYKKLRTDQFARMSIKNDPSDPTENENFLDILALSKPGVSILKLRWNYAMQMLVAQREEPVFIQEDGQINQFVRATKLNELKKCYEDTVKWPDGFWPLGKPRTRDMVSKSLFDGAFEFSEKKSADSIIEFIKLVYDLIIHVDYMKDLAESVPRAVGISKFLDDWQSDLDLSRTRLVSRPHHQAGVDRDSERIALLTTTDLELFRPDYVFDGDTPRFIDKNLKWHSEEQVGKGVALLFAFFERMGFSTDIAAVDAANNAVDQQRLLESIIKLQLNDSILEYHELLICAPTAAFTFAPEQPRVGYNFIHVAVVPSEFLKLLTNLTFLDSEQEQEQEQEKQKKLEAVMKWLNFRKINPPLNLGLRNQILYALAEISSLVLRVNNTEFQNLQIVHVDRRTTSPMPIPDTNTATVLVPIPSSWGHFFDVLVAPLSRFEPLQEWLDRDRRITIPWSELDNYAHQIELCPTLTTATPGSPEADSQFSKKSNLAVFPMTTSVFPIPHRTRIQFIYRTSDYGRRALLNRIAETRTGFQGTDLQFSFFPIDMNDQDPRRWGRVLNGVKHAPENSPIPKKMWRNSLGEGPQSLPNSLPGERLVCLENLPPGFNYRMTVGDSFLNDPIDVPSAFGVSSRQPKLLAYHQPALRESNDPTEYRIFEFTVFLTRHFDQLTDLEISNTPPDLRQARLKAESPTLDQSLKPLSIMSLPDLTMGYRIFCKYPGPPSHDKPRGESYMLAAQISLQWHPSYIEETTSTTEQETLVMIQAANDQFELVKGNTGKLYVPILYHGQSDAPTSFMVQFSAKVKSDSQYFKGKQDFRMQATRGDADAETLIDFV